MQLPLLARVRSDVLNKWALPIIRNQRLIIANRAGLARARNLFVFDPRPEKIKTRGEKCRDAIERTSRRIDAEYAV